MTFIIQACTQRGLLYQGLFSEALQLSSRPHFSSLALSLVVYISILSFLMYTFMPSSGNRENSTFMVHFVRHYSCQQEALSFAFRVLVRQRGRERNKRRKSLTSEARRILTLSSLLRAKLDSYKHFSLSPLTLSLSLPHLR